MFSAATSNIADELKAHKKLAIDLFSELYYSGKFAMWANTVFHYGMNVLKNHDNLTRMEFDKILVGTLLLALQRNDVKYSSSPRLQFGIEPARLQILDVLVKNQLELGDENVVIDIGTHALVNKTISFNGQFSSNESIQAIITAGLPFVTSNYFESYGITTATPTNTIGSPKH